MKLLNNQIYYCPICKNILSKPVSYCNSCNSYINLYNNSYITSIKEEVTRPSNIKIIMLLEDNKCI